MKLMGFLIMKTVSFVYAVKISDTLALSYANVFTVTFATYARQTIKLA